MQEEKDTLLTPNQAQATDLATNRGTVTSMNNGGSISLAQTRGEAELMAEIESLRRSLEEGTVPLTSPTDLMNAGTVFHIADAYRTTFTDPTTKQEGDKVVFTLIEADTGLEHKVMQSATGPRGKYADYFSLHRVKYGTQAPPLMDYVFVHGTKRIAGNYAVIFAKAPAALPV